MTVAIAAVAMTAIGMCRRGWGVSSARLAAVSKPMNSSTPYSMPKMMPGQPSAEEDGHPAVVEPAGRGADPLAEAAGHVVVQRPGGVDLLRVAGDDPAEREHPDRGQQHRQRRGDAAALAG